RARAWGVVKSPALDPITSDATDVRTLSGLSGAQVVLMTRDGRAWFVRKAARDAAHSARLRRQLDKQLAFDAIAGGAVRPPRVPDQGEIDGRFYFDMEFVRGTDGVSYLRRATYEDVRRMADRLCAYVHDVRARAPHLATSASLFDALYAKLCEVQR